MSEKPYTLIDRETGKELGLSSRDAVLGPSVVDISDLYREQGIFTYDPGFGATACCSSTITFIDFSECNAPFSFHWSEPI